MHIISYRIGCCLIATIIISTMARSEEARNYWAECNAAGKKSQADFFVYVDNLSAQNILVLGRQAGEECQRKLQNVPSDGINKMEDGYIAALGLVIGRFLQKADVSDKYRVFAEPIADSNSPRVWRRALIIMALELQDADPEVVRWKDYALVDILSANMKSSKEDQELRKVSCRVAGLILQREYKKPPRVAQEKQVLSQKITENMKLCRQLLNDTNTPLSLIQMAEDTEKRYKGEECIADVSRQTINQTAVVVPQIQGSGKTNDHGTSGNIGKPSKE